MAELRLHLGGVPVLSQCTIHQNILPSQLYCRIIHISHVTLEDTGVYLMYLMIYFHYAWFYHSLSSCVIKFFTLGCHKLD